MSVFPFRSTLCFAFCCTIFGSAFAFQTAQYLLCVFPDIVAVAQVESPRHVGNVDGCEERTNVLREADWVAHLTLAGSQKGAISWPTG